MRGHQAMGETLKTLRVIHQLISGQPYFTEPIYCENYLPGQDLKAIEQFLSGPHTIGYMTISHDERSLLSQIEQIQAIVELY